jgi:hypothetical protein
VTFTIPKSYYVYTIKIDGVAKYVGMGSKLRAWDYARYKKRQTKQIYTQRYKPGVKNYGRYFSRGLKSK